MSRFGQWLNFLGVLLLAIVCCVQWRNNQGLLDNVNRLEQTRRQQAQRISDQYQQIKDVALDLSALRQRLDISESARHADEEKLLSLKKEDIRLGKALIAWKSACKVRDVALKAANDSIAALSARCNEAVSRYNDLVGKYNALVAPAKALPQTKP